FSGTEAPYGYLDWCPISLGFNNSAPPFDKPEMRQAVNFAIDRTKLVNLAEGGAGVVAYHQFTPYVWFQKFDDAITPAQQKNGHGPAGVNGMAPHFMLSIFESQYYRPTGSPAPISWAVSRYRNPEYDAIVDKISPRGVDDPKTLDYFTQAMDIWYRDLPMVYV